MKKTISLLTILSMAFIYPTELRAQFPIEMMLRQIENRSSFDMMKESWNALWIAVPEASQKDYGIYYFRKDINLDKQPGKFVVYVTGDTRYKLYVNGTLASLGPARNDSKHWNYETVDLAPYLKEGKNVFAAQVWNEGNFTPVPNATTYRFSNDGRRGCQNHQYKQYMEMYSRFVL